MASLGTDTCSTGETKKGTDTASHFNLNRNPQHPTKEARTPVPLTHRVAIWLRPDRAWRSPSRRIEAPVVLVLVLREVNVLTFWDRECITFV